MNTKVEIKNIDFSYDKDNQIINDVSLFIEKGEFLSILGASGSGKSTILRLISNILPADKSQKLDGSISIFGKTPSQYLNTGKLSFMFQEASLMPNLNARDNIQFPLKLRGEQIDVSFIDELIKVVGLTEHSNKYPSELSGGMKTRVSLARAFVTKPELLLLDEPFSALDISWRYELYQYLIKVANKYGTTLVMVTHDIQEAVLLGDNIIVLSKNGTKLTEMNPKKEKLIDFSHESVNKILEANLNISLELQTAILIDGKAQS